MSEEEKRYDYDVLNIPLGTTFTDREVPLDASIITIGQCPIDVQCKVNDSGGKSFSLLLFRSIKMPIKRLYLTISDTSTDNLVIFYSKAVEVEPAPASGRAILTTPTESPYDARKLIEAAADSTTTNLGDGATYTGSQFATAGYNKITGTVYSNRSGTLYVDQSPDGTNYDIVDSISYTGGNTDGGFSVEVVAPYARVRFTNSAGAAQTAFRLYARLSSGA